MIYLYLYTKVYIIITNLYKLKRTYKNHIIILRIIIVLCLISDWLGDSIPSFFEMFIESFSIFSLISTRKENMPMQNTTISAMSASVAMNGYLVQSDNTMTI